MPRPSKSSTTDLRSAVEQAVAEGRTGDRLWLYATYHCNLACSYCLTESAPGIANRRQLARATMVRAAEEARELGFGSVGVTGGEVFMVPDFPQLLAELAAILPTVALTNATLFSDRMLARLVPLAALPVALQISLDSDEPDRNDHLRGPGNFAKVMDAIPRLLDLGIEVRIATTVEYQSEDELERVCLLHRRFGIPDEHHVVRPVVRRGRAALERMGVELGVADVLPELTVTADGAFLNPFAPTVRHGATDLDLLVGRQLLPLAEPVRRFLRVVADQPVGDDVVRNIR
jgi:sulfatase maturation enzyme AslB (radical SAM superfamily)